MAKSLKKWVKSLLYREEATILCLTLLSVASALLTIVMCFFNLSKATVLFVISIILIAALIFYRSHHHIQLRSSITTLKNAHATRRKRRRQ